MDKLTYLGIVRTKGLQELIGTVPLAKPLGYVARIDGLLVFGIEDHDVNGFQQRFDFFSFIRTWISCWSRMQRRDVGVGKVASQGHFGSGIAGATPFGNQHFVVIGRREVSTFVVVVKRSGSGMADG